MTIFAEKEMEVQYFCSSFFDDNFSENIMKSLIINIVKQILKRLELFETEMKSKMNSLNITEDLTILISNLDNYSIKGLSTTGLDIPVPLDL